jgi:hypothetical protein
MKKKNIVLINNMKGQRSRGKEKREKKKKHHKAITYHY